MLTFLLALYVEEFDIVLCIDYCEAAGVSVLRLFVCIYNRNTISTALSFLVMIEQQIVECHSFKNLEGMVRTHFYCFVLFLISLN